MARGGWAAARWRIWASPAAGFAAALGLTCLPGLPFAAGRWPAAGPFGAFTWAAWFVSTALAVTSGPKVTIRIEGAKSTLLATTTVQAPGSGSITVDGAPAGKYALTVTWPSPPPPGKEEGHDRFKGRYGDRRRPIRQVEVTPGENVLEPVRLP